jgi:hypothetical protein
VTTGVGKSPGEFEGVEFVVAGLRIGREVGDKYFGERRDVSIFYVVPGSDKADEGCREELFEVQSEGKREVLGFGVERFSDQAVVEFGVGAEVREGAVDGDFVGGDGVNGDDFGSVETVVEGEADVDGGVVDVVRE